MPRLIITYVTSESMNEYGSAYKIMVTAKPANNREETSSYALCAHFIIDEPNFNHVEFFVEQGEVGYENGMPTFTWKASAIVRGDECNRFMRRLGDALGNPLNIAPYTARIDARQYEQAQSIRNQNFVYAQAQGNIASGSSVGVAQASTMGQVNAYSNLVGYAQGSASIALPFSPKNPEVEINTKVEVKEEPLPEGSHHALYGLEATCL